MLPFRLYNRLSIEPGTLLDSLLRRTRPFFSLSCQSTIMLVSPAMRRSFLGGFGENVLLTWPRVWGQNDRGAHQDLRSLANRLRIGAQTFCSLLQQLSACKDERWPGLVERLPFAQGTFSKPHVAPRGYGSSGIFSTRPPSNGPIVRSSLPPLGGR